MDQQHNHHLQESTANTILSRTTQEARCFSTFSPEKILLRNSVLSILITVWLPFASSRLQQVVFSAEKIISCEVTKIEDLYTIKANFRIVKIAADPKYPSSHSLSSCHGRGAPGPSPPEPHTTGPASFQTLSNYSTTPVHSNSHPTPSQLCKLQFVHRTLHTFTLSFVSCPISV